MSVLPTTRRWLVLGLAFFGVQRCAIAAMQWQSLGVTAPLRQISVGLLNDAFVMGILVAFALGASRLRNPLQGVASTLVAAAASLVTILTLVNLGHIWFYGENVSLYQLSYLKDADTLFDSFRAEVSGRFVLPAVGVLILLFSLLAFYFATHSNLTSELQKLRLRWRTLAIYLIMLVTLRSGALSCRLILHEPLETQIVTYLPFRLKLDLKRNISFPTRGFAMLASHTGHIASTKRNPMPSIGRKNVIFIMLESMAFDTVANKKEATPFLNSLMTDSHWTTLPNHLTNVYRTVGAHFSAECSRYDPLAFYAIRDYPQTRSICLPRVLTDHGYSTTFVSAGKEGFDNINEWSALNGFQHVVTDNDFPASAERNSYGIHDGYFFDKVLEEADRSPQPFFVNGITITSHHPYTVPASFKAQHPELANKSDWERAFFYGDFELARFFATARSKPWFKDTLFVLAGDHPHWGYSDRERRTEESWHDYRRDRVRVFAAISFAGVKFPPPTRLTSHVDLAPTILGLLDIESPQEFVGYSVFRSEEPRWVGTAENNRNSSFQIANASTIIDTSAAFDRCSLFEKDANAPSACSPEDIGAAREFAETFFFTTQWAIISAGANPPAP